MTAASLYTAQTPTQSDSATSRRTIGNIFTVSSSGYSTTRGRVWVLSGGLPATTGLWQLWNADTQTKLAQVDFLALLGSPSTNAWSPYFTVPSVALSTGVNYYVGQHVAGAPGYPYTDGVPATFPFGNSPIVSSNTGNFQNGGDSNTWASSTYAAYFFADVEVDSGQSVNVTHALETDSTFSIGDTLSVGISVGQAVGKDSTFTIGKTLSLSVTVAQALEKDSAFSMVQTAFGKDLGPTYAANKLADTVVHGVPTLTLGAALVLWANKTGDTSLIEALNRQASLSLPNWLELQGILNRLAGTTDLSVQQALNVLAGL